MSAAVAPKLVAANRDNSVLPEPVTVPVKEKWFSRSLHNPPSNNKASPETPEIPDAKDTRDTGTAKRQSWLLSRNGCPLLELLLSYLLLSSALPLQCSSIDEK